jgi:predicted 3-demethylubiquinone-9 3-methyltransferase (glyoxalase superfamily)
VKLASLTIGGQTLLCIASPVKHPFTCTPAFSLFVDCESEAVVQRLYSALSADGAMLMPLGEYGFSRQFAWISDRFGSSIWPDTIDEGS